MHRTPRTFRLNAVARVRVAVGIVLLGACGSSHSAPATSSTNVAAVATTSSASTETSVEPTPQTFPVSSNSPTTQIECPTQEISKETKEPFGDILQCTTGWAVGIPQRIAATFNGDTDVEAEWVLAKTSGGWKVVGICHIYYPIYPTGSTCAPAYDDTSVKIALLPPMPVQCTLWSAATWSEFVKETGCQSSE